MTVEVIYKVKEQVTLTLDSTGVVLKAYDEPLSRDELLLLETAARSLRQIIETQQESQNVSK